MRQILNDLFEELETGRWQVDVKGAIERAIATYDDKRRKEGWVIIAPPTEGSTCYACNHPAEQGSEHLTESGAVLPSCKDHQHGA